MVCLVAAEWMFVEAPVPQRGGASRRINGRGLWRGEAKGEEGESGPLWQGAISHPLTQAHSLPHIYTNAAAVTGLSPQPARPPCGCDTLTQITCYRGQRGASQSASGPSSSPSHRRIHMHTHTCGFSTRFSSSDYQAPNSRVRRGCVHVGTN